MAGSMGNCLAVALLALLGEIRPEAQVRYQSNPTAIIIVAHQDDWQLFMGDLIARELKAGGPAIFIYLMAGDDGRDSVYWQTRERAALRSTAVASGRSAVDSGMCGRTMVRSHEIRSCTVGTISSYFLRLPDGRRGGTGFARYGKQSLRKLRGNAISSVTAVDGSTRYNGWNDLAATVRDLISLGDAEGTGRIHTTDPSIAINPHDHFDHRLAGYLVADLRPQLSRPTLYYVGYALGTRAANRTGRAVREKTSIFRAYDAEMTRVDSTWGAYSEHPAFYSQCMLRTYRRLAPTPRSGTAIH